MRNFRKNATNRFVISLEDGPITLSDKFTEDWRWASGDYQKRITTEKGVRIIVQGKTAHDGSNTNLYITFEKEKGFTRTDLDDAISFIRGTDAKAKKVDTPASGFIHDHLGDILIKGKTIEDSDKSVTEEPKTTTKKRRLKPDQSFTVDLENGQLTLDHNFKAPVGQNNEPIDFSGSRPPGYFQKTCITKNGITITVSGVNKNETYSNLRVRVSQHWGLTQADVNEAIGIIKTMGAKVTQVTTNEQGFLQDHLEETLIRGKDIAEPDSSMPPEKPKVTAENRRLPGFNSDKKKLNKVDIEKLKDELCKSNYKLIYILRKIKDNALERLCTLSTDHSTQAERLDKLMDVNGTLLTALSIVQPFTTASKDSEKPPSERLETLYQEAGKRWGSPQLHRMANKQESYTENFEFQPRIAVIKSRIAVLKTHVEGNETLLDKINEYEKSLETSGILNNPQNTSTISAALTELETECEQALVSILNQAQGPRGN